MRHRLGTAGLQLPVGLRQMLRDLLDDLLVNFPSKCSFVPTIHCLFSFFFKFLHISYMLKKKLIVLCEGLIFFQRYDVINDYIILIISLEFLFFPHFYFLYREIIIHKTQCCRNILSQWSSEIIPSINFIDVNTTVSQTFCYVFGHASFRHVNNVTKTINCGGYQVLLAVLW